jgi:hypothetical protein
LSTVTVVTVVVVVGVDNDDNSGDNDSVVVEWVYPQMLSLCFVKKEMTMSPMVVAMVMTI